MAPTDYTSNQFNRQDVERIQNLSFYPKFYPFFSFLLENYIRKRWQELTVQTLFFVYAYLCAIYHKMWFPIFQKAVSPFNKQNQPLSRVSSNYFIKTICFFLAQTLYSFNYSPKYSFWNANSDIPQHCSFFPFLHSLGSTLSFIGQGL